MSDAEDRAKAALDDLGPDAGPYQIEKYREWLGSGGPRELLAEVERLSSACKTLGKTIDGQCRMVLNITGLHHLVDETGDGDWGLIWEKLAELGSGRMFDE